MVEQKLSVCVMKLGPTKRKLRRDRKHCGAAFPEAPKRSLGMSLSFELSISLLYRSIQTGLGRLLLLFTLTLLIPPLAHGLLFTSHTWLSYPIVHRAKTQQGSTQSQ